VGARSKRETTGVMMEPPVT